jgi:hypothetical protein
VGSEVNVPWEPGIHRGRTTQPLYFSHETRIRQPLLGRSRSLRTLLARVLSRLRIIHGDFCC